MRPPSSLSASGSNDINISHLEAPHFSLAFDGSGEIRIQGTGQTMEAALDGASELYAKGFKTHRAEITLNGAGHAEIHAGRALSAEINGAGEILCWGDPPSVRQEIDGVGEIIFK